MGRDPRLISAQFFREPDEPGQEPSFEQLENLIGIAVSDRQSLEGSLDALKALGGQGMELFEEREYLDHTIYVSKQAMPEEMTGAPGQRFAYMLTSEYLFFSMTGPGPLETVLGSKQNPARSIWNRADVKAAIEALPADASSVYYYDVGSLAASMFKSLVTFQKMAAGGGEDDDEGGPLRWIDPETPPDPDLLRKYFGIGVGCLQKDGSGLYTRVRLLAP